MNTIERQVYALQNAYVQPIEIVQSTNAVSIRITVADYAIPNAAQATAYALGKGQSDPAAVLADISGNAVIFTPPANFFAEGSNSLQIRLTESEGRNLATFSVPVICYKDAMNDEGQVQDPTLLSQILGKLGEIKEMTEPEMDDIIAGAFSNGDSGEVNPDPGGDTPEDEYSYNQLKDKPSINGKELLGEMTTQDIGVFGEEDEMSGNEMEALFDQVFQ